MGALLIRTLRALFFDLELIPGNDNIFERFCSPTVEKLSTREDGGRESPTESTDLVRVLRASMDVHTCKLTLKKWLDYSIL